MINFLHTFEPNPVLISFGSLNIHWYGLCIVMGILLAIFVGLNLVKYYGISKDKAIDFAFWITIAGIIGARLYHVFLEFDYYWENPINIFKIWNGGVTIHGGIAAGLIVAFIFSRVEKIKFWRLSACSVTGLALGQAIGRCGNYFNQELFGLPTSLPWGIPINIMNRPLEFISSEYFHPTFIYESIGTFLIFLTLISAQIYLIKNNKANNKNAFYITITYLIMYSLLRFFLEFIRIDRTPEVLGLRFPQINAIILIIFSIGLLVLPKIKKGVKIY